MKKSHIEQDSLTSEEFAILSKVANNPFLFANHIYLIHPLRGKVKFDLYPFQKAVLLSFIQNRFNIILKFRQAGVTELISMFCLWFAMFHPHKNIVIISIKDRVAKKVLRKIKFMYKNLPPFLRTRVVNGKGTEIGTQSELEFANGSIISSIPTTEEAGRSEAVSLLVIDEAAIVRWADRIWAAAFPTLSTGGRAILNSTPYGVGNLFHKTFDDACRGGNLFTPIRLHWQMHPERDMAWYNQQKEILGPRKTAQEIDGDFLTSGNTVFDLADIKTIEELIADAYEDAELGISYKTIKTYESGLLRVYEDPKPHVKYFLGMDIATGRSQDYTAFSIMDSAGDEKVAYKGKIPIDKAERLAAKWGLKYNRALVAPESNDIGLGVAMNLQTHGYPNLYYSKALLKKKNRNKPEVSEIPGWYTTKKNRPIIIAELEEDVRTEAVNIKSPSFCAESYTFIYDSRNRPIAMNKDKRSGDELFDDNVYTDDAIFSEAITNFIRKRGYSKGSALPR